MLIGRFYYIHAIDYDRGGEWAGTLYMCTDDKSFTIRDVKECVKRGYKRTGFFEVDTGEERDWTVRLTDPEGEAKSPNEAQSPSQDRRHARSCLQQRKDDAPPVRGRRRRVPRQYEPRDA